MEWRLRSCGDFCGDVIDSPPKFPTRDAWVVLGDNGMWATCWNGGLGCTVHLVGDATSCLPGCPTGNVWVVFDDNGMWAMC